MSGKRRSNKALQLRLIDAVADHSPPGNGAQPSNVRRALSLSYKEFERATDNAIRAGLISTTDSGRFILTDEGNAACSPASRGRGIHAPKR